MTIVLPNSIEWIQAVLAAGSSARFRSRCPPRLPDAEFDGMLELRPRALIVGREIRAARSPSVPAISRPIRRLSDAPLPEAVSPVWKSMASGGSTGRPKLIEAGGDSRFPGAPSDSRWAPQEGDVNLIVGAADPQHRLHHVRVGLLLGHHLVLMPRFDAAEFLRLVTEHRVTFLATVPTIMQRLLPVYRADPDAYDLSSIRRFWHVGAPCPPAVKQAWIDLLGPEVRLGVVRRHRTSGDDLPQRRRSGWRTAARWASSSPAR